MASSEVLERCASGTSIAGDGWRKVKFGDVVRQVKVRVDPESSGLERYVAGEHMETDNLHISSWGTIGDGYLGPAFHMKFTKGQVLYGSRRTYLRKVAVATFDGICANTTFVVEPKGDALLPELLPFIMQTESFHAHSIKESKGSVNPYVNWGDIAKYEFALPPKDEQQRIVGILWAADEAIVKYQVALSQLKSSVAAIFDSAVQQGACLAELGKESTLRDALSDIVAGRSPVGSSEPATLSEYGVLKVSAVGESGFLPEENKALLDQSDFVPAFEVKAGFLLVTRANALLSGVGRACIVEATRPGLMLSDKTLRLVVDETKARPRFLLEALRSKKCRQYIESVASGTDARNISQAKLLQSPIPLPSIAVQRKVERLLLELDKSNMAIKIHIDRLRDPQRQLTEYSLRPEGRSNVY